MHFAMAASRLRIWMRWDGMRWMLNVMLDDEEDGVAGIIGEGGMKRPNPGL